MRQTPKMRRHWETHLYSYAVALHSGDAIMPENLAGLRLKAIRQGHTEVQCQIVEKDPMHFIHSGRLVA